VTGVRNPIRQHIHQSTFRKKVAKFPKRGLQAVEDPIKVAPSVPRGHVCLRAEKPAMVASGRPRSRCNRVTHGVRVRRLDSETFRDLRRRDMLREDSKGRERFGARRKVVVVRTHLDHANAVAMTRRRRMQREKQASPSRSGPSACWAVSLASPLFDVLP
jgi:hypothetical protein